MRGLHIGLRHLALLGVRLVFKRLPRSSLLRVVEEGGDLLHASITHTALVRIDAFAVGTHRMLLLDVLSGWINGALNVGEAQALPQQAGPDT